MNGCNTPNLFDALAPFYETHWGREFFGMLDSPVPKKTRAAIRTW